MTDSGEPRETDPMTDFAKLRETIERGGAAKYHEAAAALRKLIDAAYLDIKARLGSALPSP